MRIGILSDTHDHLANARKAVAIYNNEDCGHVLHGGDLISPFSAKVFADLKCPFAAVFGNNDGERLGVEKVIAGFGGTITVGHTPLTLGGMRILLMHEPWSLESIARSGDYDLIVYGHTHHKEERHVGGTIVLNPGEAGGHLTGEATCTIVDTKTREVRWITL